MSRYAADRPAPLADDQISLIRLETMDGQPVLLGIDGDRPHPQFRRRAEHADGDLAAIGYQQFFRRGGRWRVGLGPSLKVHIVARIYRTSGAAKSKFKVASNRPVPGK